MRDNPPQADLLSQKCGAGAGRGERGGTQTWHCDGGAQGDFTPKKNICDFKAGSVTGHSPCPALPSPPLTSSACVTRLPLGKIQPNASAPVPWLLWAPNAPSLGCLPGT